MSDQTPHTEQSGLTPEQTLALETARTDRIKAQADLLREQARTGELKATVRANTEASAIKEAISQTGVRFYEDELVIQLAKNQYDIQVDDNGTATGIVSGQRVPLAEAFRDIAKKHPTLADGRTTKALREPEPEPVVLNRATMTRQEKIEYLKTHSVEEFEALPSRPPMRTVEVKDIETFSTLPMQTRMKLVAEHGPDWVGRLPRRDGKGIHRFGV